MVAEGWFTDASHNQVNTTPLYILHRFSRKVWVGNLAWHGVLFLSRNILKLVRKRNVVSIYVKSYVLVWAVISVCEHPSYPVLFLIYC